jgi:hypothetical protein
VTAALHTVHVRVNDAATGLPTPCRVRFTGPDGTCYAPFGRLTEFATAWGEDVGGNLLLGSRKFAVIDGACEIRLPPGPLRVEVAKGFEHAPLCESIHLKAGQLALRLAVERWVDLRSEGWYSGDTGVYCLSPHAALLEAAAENVAVVNLLAFERHYWEGRVSRPPVAVPNILAFSGQRPALEMPGHLVIVNTHNTSLLGHLSLLNCHRVVYPLSLADRTERDNWSMGDWCDQCHRKGGLVVWSEPWPAGSDQPIGEPLAHLILGKVDALEATVLPHPGLLDAWYQLLGCGYRVPLVGGSAKGSNTVALGSLRTYAHLGPGEEFSYKNWIEAVRAGRVFVTNGPLLSLAVDGRGPGAVIDLGAAGGTVRVRAELRSNVPVERLELVAGGVVVAGTDTSGSPTRALLEIDLPIAESGWLAARCHGVAELTGGAGPQRAYAHSAPVYLPVEGRPFRPDPRAIAFVLSELDRILPWAEGEGIFANEDQRRHYAGIVHSAREVLLRRQQGAPPVT